MPGGLHGAHPCNIEVESPVVEIAFEPSVARYVKGVPRELKPDEVYRLTYAATEITAPVNERAQQHRC